MVQEDVPPEMAEDGVPAERSGRSGHRVWLIALTAGAGLLLAMVLTAWLMRERLASDLIASELEKLGLPASYEVVSIGTERQILRNIVIGDPQRPDLTIERAEVAISPRLGMPKIGRITLVKPRLYGSFRSGHFSFGSLDPLLFTGSEEPFRLPDLDLAIRDGRALIESEFGPVGLKLAGRGRLRDGFSGVIAAVAPRVQAGGCRAEAASLYGRISVAKEKPRFAGPLRLRGLSCRDAQLRLASADADLDLTFDRQLDGFEGSAKLAVASLALGEQRLASAGATSRFTVREGNLTARYDIAAKGVATPQAALASGGVEGLLRASTDFSRIELDGDLDGSDLRLGPALDAALARAEEAGRDTLAAPIVGQIRQALLREGRNSDVSGSFIIRRSGDRVNLVVPRAALRGGSGETLLAVSRLQLASGGDGVPVISGNFATAGEGLPRIVGRMERHAGGQLAMQLRMPEYRAGSASLALRRLAVVQSPRGALGFSGEARLSGELPGGEAENLILPIDGNWSAAGGLAMWRSCTPVRFDALSFANLTIDRRSITLCPPRGGAILRSARDGGVRIAAGAPRLDVAGRLGSTPIRLVSGPIGFAVPGQLTARSLDVALGPAATASRFRIADLKARIGRDIGGRFTGSDIHLNGVPLDLLGASGDWRYADGRLSLTNGSFRLEDREAVDRFQPLMAEGAELQLGDNLVTAEAVLREPQSGREVVRTVIHHNLASGRGDADLIVDGLLFDEEVQPDTVSRLALGVIANARGTVRGRGRIDWNAEAMSSTGSFTTDDLDFAAAFGPVTGASGTIIFTDLLGLVTAPNQKLRVASINPGIQVLDGVVTYELQPASVLQVDGGSWPFLDGKLTLLPVTMRIGVSEVRRYTLVVEGLNAARFVEQMELGNLAATGTFDGMMPLVFDENGGRIEGGHLRSRPPGGNVSYVGELSYKDLSTMANFAFDALRSLDYREMTIGMDGALDGELVTRVRFYGVRQGAGAERNFLTDRIMKLPIQFNINVRAPFFQLISSFKSLSDPAFVRDPRTLGLIDAEGQPIAHDPAAPPPSITPPQDIQPPASETMQ